MADQAMADREPADRATAVRQPQRSEYRSKWFVTLFMADLWERFGFYGLQAILVLYAVASPAKHGLGLPATDAAALFGAWMGLTFMLSLPGGWLADRWLGARPAMLAGGVVITLGYLCLSLPAAWFTPVGLLLVSLGTGLYKPNYQAMVNLMFRSSGRREAGISLVYIGIQVSALIAPLVTGFLGERVNWHLGFAAAGVTMLICVVQLALSSRHFGDVGAAPGRPLEPARRRVIGIRIAAVAIPVAVLGLVGLGTGAVPPRLAIVVVGLTSLLVPVIGYVVLYRNPGLEPADRRRLRAFLWVLVGATLFWMIIAQDGSVLTLFARDDTDRDVAGFSVPASWLQSATPLFILLLAPVFAWLLPRMGRGGTGVPVKFSIGLLLAGGSFLLMAAAARLAADGTKVSPGWLMVAFFMHACGEIIVAAVGIAATADVLPRRYLSQTLGIWWLFAALGGGLGSQVVRLSEAFSLSGYFLGVGVVVTAFGLALAVRRRAVVAALAGTPAIVETVRAPEPAAVA